MHGAADGTVGPAAADVGQGLVDLLIGRARLGLEKRSRGHDEAGLTVSALGHLLLDPGTLHRMKSAATEALDRGHRLAGGIGDLDRARAHRRAVEMHGARAAGRDAAAEFRTDDIEVLPQYP